MKAVNRLMRRLGVEVRRVDRRRGSGVTLEPPGASRGDVLLSFETAPFLAAGGVDARTPHGGSWVCWQMARTFIGLGYRVDVIDHTDRHFRPRKDYALFVDVLRNMERLAPLLPDRCMRVFHAQWPHWLHNNHAEYLRHLELRERRGIAFSPVSALPPNQGIEIADAAVILGGENAAAGYAYAGKPVVTLPIPGARAYPWSTERDIDICRRRFLWFGGRGLVHKGLDLVLDAFAAMPELQLTVCGAVTEEKAFETAYYRELYETPNIETVGWADIDSARFLAMTRGAIAVLHPSCTGRGAANVLACMQRGLIPVVTKDAGIECGGDCGVVLRRAAVDDLKEAVRELAGLPAARLEAMSRGAWELAHTQHSRERFAAACAHGVQCLLEWSIDRSDAHPTVAPSGRVHAEPGSIPGVRAASRIISG